MDCDRRRRSRSARLRPRSAPGTRTGTARRPARRARSSRSPRSIASSASYVSSSRNGRSDCVRLLAIPRTAARRSQRGHDADEARERAAGARRARRADGAHDCAAHRRRALAGRRSSRRRYASIRRLVRVRVSRHRHVARRADDWLRLRRLPVDRPARHAIAPVHRRRAATTACACWWTRRRTCARRRCAHDLRRIDAILFTHAHADHVMGLDEVRRFNMLSQRADAGLRRRARRSRELRRTFGYVFESDAPKGGGVPDLRLWPIGGAVLPRAGRRSCPCRSGTGRGRSSGSGSAGSRI